MYEALGVRMFEPAPDGFDPLKASARQLLAHGYPARPDPQLHPELVERWERLMSRPMTFVEPKFASMEHKRDWAHPTYDLPAGNGWAGGIKFAAKGDTVTWISGEWTVPHVFQPKPGNCIAAEWVGIDGANDDPNGPDSGDILQAGTTQMIVGTIAGPIHFSFAWWEWFPEGPHTITNLPVSPGDIMQCTICVYSATEAGVHLWNLTARVGTSFVVKPRNPKIALVGNSAEWILEDPTDADLLLARFGDVYFDNCVAGTQDGKLLLGGTGRLDPMYDFNGHNIAVPRAENDWLIKVEYTDESP
jgi:hypothetical protein